MKETELVVLVGADRRVATSSRDYNIGPDITAYQHQREVILREARTGNRVASTTLKGSVVRPPQSAPISQTSVYGSAVDYTDVEEWVRPFVRP